MCRSCKDTICNNESSQQNKATSNGMDASPEPDIHQREICRAKHLKSYSVIRNRCWCRCFVTAIALDPYGVASFASDVERCLLFLSQ